MHFSKLNYFNLVARWQFRPPNILNEKQMQRNPLSLHENSSSISYNYGIRDERDPKAIYLDYLSTSAPGTESAVQPKCLSQYLILLTLLTSVYIIKATVWYINRKPQNAANKGTGSRGFKTGSCFTCHRRLSKTKRAFQ